MTSLTFGATLIIVGMGGTLLTLYLVSLLIRAITVIFPVKNQAAPDSNR